MHLKKIWLRDKMYKNVLIKILVILFVFFCIFGPIDSIFEPIVFFA